MRSKSSIESGTPASRATARRWSTTLVDPPDIAAAAIAFSSASLVMIPLGRRSVSSSSIASMPTLSATSPFLPSSAGTIALPIGEIPSTSNAIAIVLAVYWPPQAPAPGEAWLSRSVSSSSVRSPAAWAPTPSNTSWIVTSLSRQRPGAIEAPQRITLGALPAAEEHHARHVEPSQRHHAARDGLVTARHGDHRIEHVPARHELDRV